MKKILIFIFIILSYVELSYQLSDELKSKTIFIVMLARNKEHTLPYFLSHFENLSYPKDRISLFIRSDHNTDNTHIILQKWLDLYQNEYHSVDAILSDNDLPKYFDEIYPANWSEERFDHVINIKEMALKSARSIWADYILFLDLDVFIIDSNILQTLIDENRPIIGPMLDSLGSYSNFWGGMTDEYWYTRTDDYFPILNRKKIGCFNVPMVHSFVLLDLTRKNSDHLSFLLENIHVSNNKSMLPKDDIIDFAVSSQINNMDMFVCNQKIFGFIPPPLQSTDQLKKDYSQLSDLKLEALIDLDGLFVHDSFKQFEISNPVKSTLGFDNIYLINLAERSDRKLRMEKSFDILGIKTEVFDAVDGKRLNASYLENMGIKQLHDYKDPWSKRDMTYGEIGCFLSHYFIWKDIVENQYKKVIVFEDDIRFEQFFNKKLNILINDMQHIGLSWDFVYLGRKILKKSEDLVDGSKLLVHADYSYWTLCYIITLEGAKKLLSPEPLAKIVPVDEYIPIMFDKHPEESWMSSFSPRNLKAYSASPLLVYPTHYLGDVGFISDTETSSIITEDSIDPIVQAANPVLKTEL